MRQEGRWSTKQRLDAVPWSSKRRQAPTPTKDDGTVCRENSVPVSPRELDDVPLNGGHLDDAATAAVERPGH